MLLARCTDKVVLSDRNRRILHQAYDDGDGHGITLVPGDDPPWFVGMYEDTLVCEGIEHEGTLYTVANQSGGGLVSVLIGTALIENELGLVYHSTEAAKAYVQGRMAT